MFWMFSIAIIFLAATMYLCNKGGADGWMYVFLGVIVFLFGILVGGIIAANVKCEVEKNETTYHEILPINGYYVDDKFRCVTIDNLRLDFDGEGYTIIKVGTLKNPPYVKHYIYKDKNNIFGLPKDVNTYSIVFEIPTESDK